MSFLRSSASMGALCAAVFLSTLASPRDAAACGDFDSCPPNDPYGPCAGSAEGDACVITSQGSGTCEKDAEAIDDDRLVCTRPPDPSCVDHEEGATCATASGAGGRCLDAGSALVCIENDGGCLERDLEEACTSDGVDGWCRIDVTASYPTCMTACVDGGQHCELDDGSVGTCQLEEGGYLYECVGLDDGDDFGDDDGTWSCGPDLCSAASSSAGNGVVGVAPLVVFALGAALRRSKGRGEGARTSRLRARS